MTDAATFEIVGLVFLGMQLWVVNSIRNDIRYYLGRIDVGLDRIETAVTAED